MTWLLAGSPLWLFAAARAHDARHGRAAIDLVSLLRRWCRLLVSCMRSARAAWWAEFTMEPVSCVMRYVQQLECLVARNRLVVRPKPETIRRVLVVRLGHLGDILHMAPFARSLKRQMPGCEIDLLCGPWTELLAHKLGCFDRVIPYAPDLHQFHRGDDRKCMSLRGEWRFFGELRDTGYDAMISTSPVQLIDAVLEQAVCPAVWIGAASDEKELPCHGFRFLRPFESRTREADWVSGFLEAFGLEPGDTSLAYPLSREDRHTADELLRKAGVVPGRPLVALAPGAGWPGKCWPAEHFRSLAGRLCGTRGATCVVLGSKDERPLADIVCAGSGTGCISLAGACTLDVSAAILERCAVLICNDSALLHVAAAVDTPTVSLFGPTFPEKWAPPGSLNRVIRSSVPCEGCWYWHCLARCKRDVACTASITESEVLSIVDKDWDAWIQRSA